MSLFTWCALDTLIFPVWLERSAQVSSSCPVTGRPLHLIVTPEGLERLDTPSGVTSLLLQEGPALRKEPRSRKVDKCGTVFRGCGSFFAPLARASNEIA